MQFSDFELEFTASSAAHVSALQSAVAAYLAASADLPAQLDELLSDDPDMPLALCFQGYLLKLAAHPGLQPTITEIVQRAARSAAHANRREQQHIHALQAWDSGDVNTALACLEAITDEYPQDMIALRLAHYMHFYNGSGAAMAASTGKVLDQWPVAHPHYSFLLGMHAFGLEEQADYRGAAHYAQAALAINRHDLWSIHAMAHVYYMQHQHDQGLQWLADQADVMPGTNNFRHHLSWHQALHHLACEDYAAVLAVYDSALAASTGDDFYLDMCNNAAILWRLEAARVDVGDRWQPLAELASQHVADRELVFASLHYLLPLIRTASPAARAFMQGLNEWADDETHQAQVVRAVGLPVAERLLATQQHEFPPAESLHRLGGSKAQRELFALVAS
ncbi:MAG: hypothetical protein RJQ07_11435 [Pseudomonadales bacterium]